MITKLKMSF